jgi:formylglycine-generating enzyme required for sulfatase activity
MKMKLKTFFVWLCLAMLARHAAIAGPTVSNVHAAQRAGTQLVDVYYDLASASNALTVSIMVSTNGGASYTLTATSFTGAVGGGIAPGTNQKVTWNAGQDWPTNFSTNVRFRVTADDANAPSGMALIPAGSFQMGDNLDGESDAPVHTVYVSAFYMDKYDVTEALWQSVYNWAMNHGYSFDYPGSVPGSAYSSYSKGPNYPVVIVDWYDCVKWCNARSEMAGKVPAYYTSTAQTVVYRTGDLTISNSCVNWNAGYRLPTEAEWEKAARGGLSGQRFPWGNTISESQANYYSYNGYSYDLSNTGYNPTFATGNYPYTSPVNYFAPNGYGLYDMAGNVWQWCWDLYGGYSSGSQTDPRGPTAGQYGSGRVFRGGSWDDYAINCRAAVRYDGGYPAYDDYGFGFRSVLPPGQ